ncbi:MAG TPA: hypothetical protein DCQ51_20815 [Planktothrix sp. UBA8407]|jgi:hypothetical protein|nr:hypothetical protein [Planktothrix sp. UBA8407]HBK24071.1 hypothetical protein [Planktothrix sp. UBA10369]
MKIITKSCLVSAAALLIGVTYSDIALTQQPAPFRGMWQGSESDGLIINTEDDGQNISAEVYSAGFDHSIRGHHQSYAQANVVVTRKNIGNNCVTKMYGIWTLINPNQFRSQIKGTDGRCELPTNYQEVRIFNRQ